LDNILLSAGGQWKISDWLCRGQDTHNQFFQQKLKGYVWKPVILIALDTNILVVLFFFPIFNIDPQGRVIGSYLWMAPEVMKASPYTKHCNVYSFGMVIWEVLAGTKPWPHTQTVCETAVLAPVPVDLMLAGRIKAKTPLLVSWNMLLLKRRPS